MTLDDIFKYKGIVNFNGFIDGEWEKVLLAPDRLVGIEIELENVHLLYKPNSFRTTEDGSLKVNGVEFVSVPIKTKYLFLELSNLFKGITNSVATSRCSIHVHVDVRDLEEKELQVLLILYSIFEKCLFRLSGDRWKSNYCVPVRNAQTLLANFIKKPYGGWYKYQALNLSPIAGGDGSNKQGTIEFRHHKGSNNPAEIMAWANIVAGLVEFSKQINLDELTGILLEANTSSCYTILTERVFKSFANLFLSLPTYKEDIEGGITFAKVVFFNHENKKPKLIPIKEFVKPTVKLLPTLEDTFVVVNVDLDDALNEIEELLINEEEF